MSPLPDDMKEQLQKEYISTFDQKLYELEQAFAARDKRKLSELFHKLVGSGKTYEMDEISSIAKVCESILSREFNEDKIRRGLDHLHQAFAARKA